MDHRLAGVEERLRRAHEHLTFLDKETASWEKAIDRTVLGYFDREASEYVFYIQSGPPPPEWGILVSEFIHHTRAALEEMAWRLVEFRGGTPRAGGKEDPGTGFPILDKEGMWKSKKTKAKLRGLFAEDKAIIKAAQPYHFGLDLLPPDMRVSDEDLLSTQATHVQFHALNLLRRMNNSDKHSVLQPALIGAAGMMQPVGEDNTFGPTGIKDTGPWGLEDLFFTTRAAADNRTEVMRVRLREPGPEPHMEMKNEVSIAITLGYGFPPWGIVRDVLWYAEEKVIKPLSEAFDA